MQYTDAMLDALVERALARLPDHQRELVILRDIEGFDHDELARILQGNLKPGAIRKRVFDAREASLLSIAALVYSAYARTNMVEWNGP